MLSNTRQVSAGSFFLLLVLFLLPFAKLTCGNQELVKFSGYELAFGKAISVPSGSAFGGSSEQHKSTPTASAILALAAAVAGAVLCAVKGRGGSITRAVTAGVGLMMLIWLGAELGDEVSKEGRGVVQLEMDVGYFLALLVFAGAGTLNAVAAALTKGAGQSGADNSSLLLAAGPKSAESAEWCCSHCGASVPREAMFCPQCGNRMPEV